MNRTVTIAAAFFLFGVMPVGAMEVRSDTELFSKQNRFLDGKWPEAARVPSVTVLDSFERELAKTQHDWMSRDVALERSREHATDGKYSLAVTFLKETGGINYRPYWEKGYGKPYPYTLGYRLFFSDEVRITVFNPGDPVQLVVRREGKRWIHLYKQKGPVKEWRIALAKGRNEIAIPRQELVYDVFRPSFELLSLVFRVEGKTPTTLYFDHFRLIGPGIGRHMIQHAKLFDFGSKVSARPFFTPVNNAVPSEVYTRERGYGWVEKVGRRRWSVPLKKMGWRAPDDELLRSSAYFSKPFLVDLPNGKYRLQLVEANPGYTFPPPGYHDLSIRINGGELKILRRGVQSVDELAKLEYGNEDADYYPGQDRWDTFKAKSFRPLECDFEIVEGQAKIELLPVTRVSFMIVYPVEKALLVEPEIAALWRDIKYRFHEAMGPITRKMPELKKAPALHEEYLAPEVRSRKKAALSITAEMKARGSICFERKPNDDVFPDSVPLPAECAGKYTAFGSPGETEALTVNVFALRDVRGAKLTVGDFVSDNADTIPADAAAVRIVGYSYRMNAQLSHGDWKYMIVPWLLSKRKAVDILADTCRRFWINVRIPGDAKPGRYVSKAVFSGNNISPTELALTFEVLPFKLDPLPAEKTFCTVIDYDILSKPISQKFRAGKLAREQILMKQLKKTEMARVQAHFDIARTYGLNTVSIRRPPPGVDPVGLKVLEIPRVRAKEAGRFFKLMRIKPIKQIKNMSEAKVAAEKQDGSQVLLSGIRTTPYYPAEESRFFRFKLGFLMWRIGADGCALESWITYWGDPYSMFDGHKGEPGWFVAYSASNWPSLNPTLILEGVRQGINDYRHLVMLQRLAGEEKGTPAAKEAEEYLAGLKAKLRPLATHYFEYNYNGSGRVNKKTGWKGADFLAERKRMAELIKKLVEVQQQKVSR